MAGIVRAKAVPGEVNYDEESTRLPMNPDRAAVEQAVATGNLQGLTLEQAKQAIDLMVASQAADRARPSPSPGPPVTGNTNDVITALSNRRITTPMTLAEQSGNYFSSGVAANAGAPGGGSDGPPLTVLRTVKTVKPVANPNYWRGRTGAFVGAGPIPGPASITRDKPMPLESYYGEYAEKIQDSAFRDWLQKRATVLTGMDPEDPRFLTTGYSLWKTAGDMVAANPKLAKSMKPEAWLDQQYKLAGGDALYDSILAEATKVEEKPNPITTQTHTQTYTITAAAAQAAIDDMSQALLGRMASGSELKRARAAMQKLLTPTVTRTTTDATDPENVKMTSSTKAGVGPSEARSILQMRMQRGSEGMAFNAGKMFEAALAKMR